MMTTDTFPKLATRAAHVEGRELRVSGVAKGAAMIAPNMATMLSVLMTDAPLAPEEAEAALRLAVGASFNCISVEGHMSTSDTVILLSSNPREAGPAGPDDRVVKKISEVAAALTCAMIRDSVGGDHCL